MRSLAQADLAALKDALLVDVREPGEYAAERLPGSLNLPLSRLREEASRLPRDRTVVLLCRSGRRAEEAARVMESLGVADVRVLEGGLSCCAGLQKGPGRVWAMERQVRLAAGTLVLAGAGLGWLVHPGFWLLSAGVGAGLVFSALTDTCGMAALLARMPWNRRRS